MPDSNAFVPYTTISKYINLPYEAYDIPEIWTEEFERIIPITPAIIRKLGRYGRVECLLHEELLGRKLTDEETIYYLTEHKKVVKNALSLYKKNREPWNESSNFLTVYRKESIELVIKTLWLTEE